MRERTNSRAQLNRRTYSTSTYLDDVHRGGHAAVTGLIDPAAEYAEVARLLGPIEPVATAPLGTVADAAPPLAVRCWEAELAVLLWGL